MFTPIEAQARMHLTPADYHKISACLTLGKAGLLKVVREWREYVSPSCHLALAYAVLADPILCKLDKKYPNDDERFIKRQASEIAKGLTSAGFELYADILLKDQDLFYDTLWAGQRHLSTMQVTFLTLKKGVA